GAHVDQRSSHDAECIRELVRLHAERRLEHLPGAGVEDFEEAAVEHDAGRIALAPRDGQLPAVNERRHSVCLKFMRCAVYKERRGPRKRAFYLHLPLRGTERAALFSLPSPGGGGSNAAATPRK